MSEKGTDVGKVERRENTIVKSDTVNNFSNIDLYSENGLKAAEMLAARLIKSSKSGVASIDEAVTMMLKAKDLGLPFSACVEHIHSINGKTGIDVHLIKALLSKAGVYWSWTKRYSPQYEYTDGINVFVESDIPDYCVKCKNETDAEDKRSKAKSEDFIYIYPVRWYSDFNGNVYRHYQLNSTVHVPIAPNKQLAVKLAADKKIGVYRIPNKPIDYVCEVEFYRRINGTLMTQKGSFSYSEAMSAGLFDKETYSKYPKQLISHRAFTYGAREIGSDILVGLMETTELKIVNGVDLDESDVRGFDDSNVTEAEVVSVG